MQCMWEARQGSPAIAQICCEWIKPHWTDQIEEKMGKKNKVKIVHLVCMHALILKNTLFCIFSSVNIQYSQETVSVIVCK